MKKLYFTRHGLTEMNVAGLWSGTIETPLTKVGKEQARVAGEHAKSLGIDTIACSTLGRAVETAEIIAKEIGYPVEDLYHSSLLVERHFGELEGQPWEPDLNMDGISDIESVDTLLERARFALEWLHTLPGDTVLVVSHGAFGRAMRSLLDVNFPFTLRYHLKNAEVIELI